MWEQTACHRDGEAVVALATDPTNSFLVSGDARGYLKVWDVHQFTNAAGLDQKHNVIEVHHWRAHEGLLRALPLPRPLCVPSLRLCAGTKGRPTDRATLSDAQAASRRLNTSRSIVSSCPRPPTAASSWRVISSWLTML